jgi:1,4-alpha-glucan branching enzyme
VIAANFAAAGACGARLGPAPPALTSDGVRFVLQYTGARSVAVAGSFNGWSPHALTRAPSQDLWSAVIPLPPGEHVFMYVVDGTWVSPPLAEDYVDDGFGSKNGVVVVRPMR